MKTLVSLICFCDEQIKNIGNALVEIFTITHENVLDR